MTVSQTQEEIKAICLSIAAMADKDCRTESGVTEESAQAVPKNDNSLPVSQLNPVIASESEDAGSQDTVDSGICSPTETNKIASKIPLIIETGVTTELVCKLSSTFKDKGVLTGGTCWVRGWRLRLCQCPKCQVWAHELIIKN